MSGENFIQIDHVHKSFGSVKAVRDVSLNIAEGEVFCLLGGSGSGKSTLLRMLAGFEDLTSGRILIDAVDTAGTPPEKRPVNMMFQSYALFPHMTVFNNIAYGLKREGVAKSEVQTRVQEVLNLVKMGDLGARKPAQLSGGQRQRVALARCLVKRPKVLLLDEPLAALDKKLREETQQELLSIQRALGLTFVVVTHDQEEAMHLANRVGIMDRGRIVQIGSPSDIYENPNSLFVAEFVGRLNKLPGTFEGRTDGQAQIRLSDTMQLASDDAIRLEKGKPVTAVIRPENVQVCAPGGGGPDARVGTIKFASFLGSQITYTITLPDGFEVQADTQNTRNGASFAAALGDTVDVVLRASDVKLFTDTDP